jgi:hypothetical protein
MVPLEAEIMRSSDDGAPIFTLQIRIRMRQRLYYGAFLNVCYI